MSTLFASLAAALKPFLLSKKIFTKVRIEEWTFRLHFRVTSILLLVCSALLSMREYIGENIRCAPTHDDESNDPLVPRKIIERYCFIQTTFTVPWDYQGTNPRNYQLDKRLGGPPYIPEHTDTIHHAYYQWVTFFLFFQALLFYIPHWIWKSSENKKIQSLVTLINMRDLTTDLKVRDDNLGSIASYIVKSKGTHGHWTFTHIACEFGNLFVVLFNVYVTDLFLGRTFSMYGPKVIAFLEEDSEFRTDPMATVFPKMTKCIFHLFGPSGSIQRFDALCILPSNILNEKIFVFLWFWFLLLTLISLYAVVRRMATIFSASLRLKQLQIHIPSAKVQTATVLNKFGISDWFLLHLLRINLDQGTFYNLIGHIEDEMNALSGKNRNLLIEDSLPNLK